MPAPTHQRTTFQEFSGENFETTPSYKHPEWNKIMDQARSLTRVTLRKQLMDNRFCLPDSNKLPTPTKEIPSRKRTYPWEQTTENIMDSKGPFTLYK